MSRADKPSDLELMMYFDGELEPARCAAVAEYLAGSSEAAMKVRALGLGGEMVARLVTRSSAADGIAASVMDAIAKAAVAHSATRDKDGPSDVELMMYFDDELEAERRQAVEAHLASSGDGAAKLAALRLGGEMLFQRAVRANGADGIADRVMAVIAKEAVESDERAASGAIKVAVASSKKPAANDNARRIYAMAAFALAAAAALLVWGRNEPTPVAVPVTSSAEVAPTVATVAAIPPAVTAATSANDDEANEPAPIHGVEVAAVEFGGKLGSIFYVPTGENGSANTTTVVWLAEDTGEE